MFNMFCKKQQTTRLVALFVSSFKKGKRKINKKYEKTQREPEIIIKCCMVQGYYWLP